MEQFFLVPASLSNNKKRLNTQTVTKQKLPKFQSEANPTYQIDGLKKEKKNKNVFAKADTFVDKDFSCIRIKLIKLSNSKILILDGSLAGLSLSDFAQQLRRKSANVPDISFTLLDAAGITPTLVLNQIATPNEGGSWVPFKV